MACRIATCCSRRTDAGDDARARSRNRAEPASPAAFAIRQSSIAIPPILHPLVLTALILAAGLGTRLQPLTRDKAKPAVPVAGRPLVEHITRRLAAEGVGNLLVNLHYRPESITGVLGDGSGLGVGVRYSWENPVLGSAGGPRRAFELVSDRRLLLVNGDTLANVDLDALIAAHRHSGALVTLAVVPNPAPDRYGGVLVDRHGVVTGFTRRVAGRRPADRFGRTSWHFTGVQIAEREAFASLADGQAAESIGALYPALMRERPGSIHAFRSEAGFHDIGTLRDYLETSLALGAGPGSTGRRATVHASARVVHSVLWDDVTVGSGAWLQRCVVMDGALVPPDFRGADLVIAPDRPGPLMPGETRMAGLRLVPIEGGAPEPLPG